MSACRAELKGNRFIAVSSRDLTQIAAVRKRFADWNFVEREGLFLASERTDCFANDGMSSVVFAVPLQYDLTTGQVFAPKQALNRSVTPHFASPAAWARLEGCRVICSADKYGLSQLYVHQASSFAVIANSATLLSEVCGAELDFGALTGFALLGSFIDTDTAFSGVSKLSAGCDVVLENGSALISKSPLDYSGNSAGEGLRDHFVTAVTRMRTAFPDAELELSGGLDSRLILAAIPQGQRPRHRAFSIGSVDSPDVRIASELAAKFGMTHRLASTDAWYSVDAQGFSTLLADICVGYDHAANPIDKLAIVSAGGDDDGRARFGGQNGEILRGFFYPAQQLSAMPHAGLARRLVEWRLFANDRVNERLFVIPDYTKRREQIATRLIDRLLSYGAPWYRALDGFYLDERMQRWVGAGCNNRFITRTSLYPFFDPSVIDAAMQLEGDEKRDSFAAYRLLMELDPELAALPLDNGIVPADVVIGRGGVSKLRRTVSKVADKLHQRLLGGSRATLGSGEAVARWHALGLHRDLPVDALKATGFLAPDALDAIVAGTMKLDRASLGFLLMMTSLVRLEESRSP